MIATHFLGSCVFCFFSKNQGTRVDVGPTDDDLWLCNQRRVIFAPGCYEQASFFATLAHFVHQSAFDWAISTGMVLNVIIVNRLEVRCYPVLAFEYRCVHSHKT